MAELVCYRASSYRTALRTRIHGSDSYGRFHEAGSEATQYLSLHPLTPWAEVARNQGCRTLEDTREMRIAVWAVRLLLTDEPTAVGFDEADGGHTLHPMTPHELVGDDRTACQALARAHRDHDAPKVIRVPSAALPGTDNIIIFGRRRMVRYEAEPLREIQMPAAVAGADARLPQGLWPFVRGFGAPHQGLETWTRGDLYELPMISTDPL
jgi:RES domain-containing protein